MIQSMLCTRLLLDIREVSKVLSTHHVEDRNLNISWKVASQQHRSAWYTSAGPILDVMIEEEESASETVGLSEMSVSDTLAPNGGIGTLALGMQFII